MERGNFRREPHASEQEMKRDAYSTFFYRFEYGGESGADVYDRLSTFLDTLHRDFAKPTYPDNCLIITHGLLIRLFMMRWFHLTVEQFESLANPDNCEIFTMELDSNKYRMPELKKRLVENFIDPAI